MRGFARYLLDGDLTVLERGQPGKPIQTGQSWHVRPGVVHEVKAGDRTTKVLAMYVVEKGKPKGVEGFRVPWRAYLGLERHSDLRPLPWQSVKAVSRRYAEGFDDGYDIRPASNLLNTMTLAIGRFLENPVRWEGNPNPKDKRLVLDRIKATVSQELTRFCPRQLREKPQPQWQEAYAFRGTGSTFDRKIKIEALYERWVPIPANEADDMRYVQEFIDEVKQLVKSAIDATQDALAADKRASAEKAA